MSLAAMSNTDTESSSGSNESSPEKPNKCSSKISSTSEVTTIVTSVASILKTDSCEQQIKNGNYEHCPMSAETSSPSTYVAATTIYTTAVNTITGENTHCCTSHSDGGKSTVTSCIIDCNVVCCEVGDSPEGCGYVQNVKLHSDRLGKLLNLILFLSSLLYLVSLCTFACILLQEKDIFC